MESDYTLVTRELWSRNYLLQTGFINPVTRLMIWTPLFYVILKASYNSRVISVQSEYLSDMICNTIHRHSFI